MTIFKSAGNLLALENKPAIDKPQKPATIYLDEIFVNHHDNILGISGKQYANIIVITGIFTLHHFIRVIMRIRQIRNIKDAMSEMINDVRYPFTPNLNLNTKKYVEINNTKAPIIPFRENVHIFPSARVYCANKILNASNIYHNTK